MTQSTSNSSRLRPATWMTNAVMLVALSACGGGGGGGSPAPAQSPAVQGPSTQYAGRCVAPRGAPYNDLSGTITDEKRWVGAWNNETYLWYDEVVDRGINAFATPIEYFGSLRTTATTPSGKDKDEFHFVYDTPTWVSLSQSGVSYGYGFNISLLSATVPRRAVVAYTDPGTPAATANVLRGSEVLLVDGVDLVNATSQAAVDILNAALFPTAPGSHTFRIRESGTSTTRDITLPAAAIASVPVQNVKTLPAPLDRVGYMQFNDHIATSEQQLVAAVTTLRDAAVTDLVLDIRYNGGGYLDIASELAYMVAGPTPTQGKVFEELRFNNKNPFGFTDAQRRTPFHTVSQDFSGPAGVALPTLNLPRVYVLVGGDTCSASESIVNGLRGAGVEVILIGNTTCGKPYGFYPTDNCGITYFTVQFQGVNALGFGNYADGLTPTCTIPDDFTHALGDIGEARLASALYHRATGNCPTIPPSSATRELAQSVSASVPGTLVRSPMRQNRMYRAR